MKSVGLLAALLFSWLLAPASAAQLSKIGDNAITKVVELLGDLQAKIESDGVAEQKSYDKYACWCEDTLASKATEITTAKDDIEKLQTTIIELNGALATYQVDIKQLEKDISANIESQREATEVRDKESAGYQEDRAENEQCIGALEAAITVLTGAGTGKRGFLETLQEAQLLGVVAGVRGLLKQPVVARSVNQQDLQVVRHFIDRPEDFVGGRTGALSAAQIANNPFGDYAPQSTQIQGILKGMYDAFTADLEKSNVEEAEKQKGFEELMSTKKMELETLQTTLEKHNMDNAEKTKNLADSKTALDDTKAQLEADELFFAQTKESCQEKASQWAQRTHLRTEELHGIGQAIAILSSPEAQKTFENATTTFLQLSASVQNSNAATVASVYDHLKTLATKYSSVSLAMLAATVKVGGHFDKVIASIDNMIELLRKEEQMDIKDRDFCFAQENKNKNDMEDLNFDIDKAKESIKRLENKIKELNDKVKALEEDIKGTEASLEELKQLRAQEEAAFLQSVKDDTSAVALVEKAIGVLSKISQNNKVPLKLVQSRSIDAPAEAPPEVSWKDGNYGGRAGESGGIIAILSMIKEDFENEIKTGRQENEAAQVNFEKDRQAMFDTLEAQKASKVATETELADYEMKLADQNEFKTQKDTDLAEEEKMKESLTKNCAWVKSHFDSRRTARQAEIDGLIEAKNFLAGMAEEA